MDEQTKKELEELAKNRREAKEQKEKQSSDRLNKIKEREENFKTGFSTLKNSTLKPYVTQITKIFQASGDKIHFHTNELAPEMIDKIRLFATVYFNAKLLAGTQAGAESRFINFEGLPNKGIVEVTRRLIPNTPPQTIGEFNIDGLDKDKAEKLVLEFIKAAAK